MNVAHLLLGAALVAIGVLAAALADRIRGVRVTRVAAPSAAFPSAKRLARPPRHGVAKADDGEANEVVGALITAGYDKRVATAATAGCSPEQRATIETWTRAALRRCAQGGLS